MTTEINELNDEIIKWNQEQKGKPAEATLTSPNTNATTNQFNWDELNKNTEGDFKSFDDIRNLRKQKQDYEAKIKEYEPLVNEHKTLKEQIAEKEKYIKENLNPLKYFGNKPEKYIQVELENKYPDKEHLIKDVVNVKNLSDLQVLKLQEKWNNPKGREAGIVASLNKRYDTDIDELSKQDANEWDDQVYNDIQRDAQIAREKLSGIPAEIKLPENPEDLSKAQQEEKANSEKQKFAQWEGFVNRPEFNDKFLNELSFYEKDEDGNPLKDKDGNVLPPYFVWKVEPDFKKQLPDIILNVAKSRGLELTQETFSGIMENITDLYEKKNRHRIDREKEKMWRAKWETEYDEKTHVPKRQDKDAGGGKATNDDPQTKYYMEWASKQGINY